VDTSADQGDDLTAEEPDALLADPAQLVDLLGQRGPAAPGLWSAGVW
jgi:hypothetical protein